MLQITLAFYILIGILINPSFIVMENMFHPNAAKTKLDILVLMVVYYFLWPFVLLYYFIQIIKYNYKRR